MARLRYSQLNPIPQDNIEGLTAELQSRATSSIDEGKIYVDPSHGSDENSGSLDSPKRTIQGAADSLPLFVNHPIEILLAKGIYTETVSFTRHVLGARGFIIVKPLDMATVVLSGDNKLENCIIVDFAQGICVRDVTIQGYIKEAIKVVNSAKIDMNKCVLRDNYIALSISNQASTYALNNCVFLNNRVGVKVFNTSNAEIKDSSFESNRIAVSVDSLSKVSLEGARVSSNFLAFESLGQSILDLKSSVVSENTNVAHVDLATLSSRNEDKSTLISNNSSGLVALKAAKIDLQNVDLINNKQVDVSIDTGSIAILEDCSIRKESRVFCLSAKRGTQMHLIGKTRNSIPSNNLSDPSQSDSIFG